MSPIHTIRRECNCKYYELSKYKFVLNQYSCG